MLICILTKNVITSCSVTMMLFLHLEVKPLMTLTTVLYLSCALISGHLAMMLMELTIEAFYDNPNALRDYFRDIGRMVLAAEGRKANDSHADCYQYFCVPEYGTANGRLH